MEVLGEYMESIEGVLQLFGVFYDCSTSGKNTLLEQAESTLRDIVYLEPILPDGESLVNTVSELVVCMRNEVEEVAESIERRCRGRPPCEVSKEQLIFLLEHGFTQSAIASMMGCSPRTINRNFNYNRMVLSRILKTVS